jgi:hypothetical protein
MRRIPAALALLVVAGGLVSLAGSPASAEESDLIDLKGVVNLDLLGMSVASQLGANVSAAGPVTVGLDGSVNVGP